MIAPIVRIVLRYGVGIFAGLAVGDAVASDPDVVNVLTAGVSVAVSALTEWWYARAKRTGGAT